MIFIDFQTPISHQLKTGILQQDLEQKPDSCGK